jgi:hypothetical protein
LAAGSCYVIDTTAGALKYVKVPACATGAVKWTAFSDATCATAVTGEDFTVTGVAAGACSPATAAKDLKVKLCAKMTCTDPVPTGGIAAGCVTPVTKKAANNSSSDNAMTASVAGALALSAAAFVFA